MKIIAMMPYYWGKGDTVDEAINQLKLTAGRIKAGELITLNVYTGADENVHVDDMGNFSYTWSEEEMKLERKDRPRAKLIGKGTIRGNSITFKEID